MMIDDLVYRRYTEFLAFPTLKDKLNLIRFHPVYKCTGGQTRFYEMGNAKFENYLAHGSQLFIPSSPIFLLHGISSTERKLILNNYCLLDQKLQVPKEKCLVLGMQNVGRIKGGERKGFLKLFDLSLSGLGCYWRRGQNCSRDWNSTTLG